jgi:hypothetical protein
MAKYIVTRTEPTIYINDRGKAVNGYVIYAYLPEFNETHEVRVERLDAESIKAILNSLYQSRVALTNLEKQ